MKKLDEKEKIEWREYTLNSLAEFLKGTGLSKDKLDPTGKNKCILYGELYTKYNEVIDSIVSRTNSSEGILSKKGDVLFPASTTTVGADLANATVLNESDVLLGGDIVVLRCDSSIVNSTFLAFYLTHFKKKEITRLTQGTTIIHLYGSSLKKLKVKIPSMSYQEKVVKILLEIDEDVKRTDKIIKSTKKLRIGLLRDLFTKGIGHKKFKETKLGLIPESWSVVLLDSVAKRGSGHTPSKTKAHYWNEGIKWVSLADSSKLDARYIHLTDKEISNEGIKNSSAVLHSAGTVILSRDAGVGKGAILASEMAVSQHFMAWQCGNDLNNLYLYYLLQNWKKKFESIATGTTIKTIGLQFFKDLEIPLPSCDEQKKIADILSRVDDRIEIYKKNKSKLLKLKKGLIQDLLK